MHNSLYDVSDDTVTMQLEIDGGALTNYGNTCYMVATLHAFAGLAATRNVIGRVDDDGAAGCWQQRP